MFDESSYGRKMVVATLRGEQKSIKRYKKVWAGNSNGKNRADMNRCTFSGDTSTTIQYKWVWVMPSSRNVVVVIIINIVSIGRRRKRDEKGDFIKLIFFYPHSNNILEYITDKKKEEKKVKGKGYYLSLNWFL